MDPVRGSHGFPYGFCVHGSFVVLRQPRQGRRLQGARLAKPITLNQEDCVRDVCSAVSCQRELMDVEV
jgi:hypothetical protein